MEEHLVNRTFSYSNKAIFRLLRSKKLGNLARSKKANKRPEAGNTWFHISSLSIQSVHCSALGYDSTFNILDFTKFKMAAASWAESSIMSQTIIAINGLLLTLGVSKQQPTDAACSKSLSFHWPTVSLWPTVTLRPERDAGSCQEGQGLQSSCEKAVLELHRQIPQKWWSDVSALIYFYSALLDMIGVWKPRKHDSFCVSRFLFGNSLKFLVLPFDSLLGGAGV